MNYSNEIRHKLLYFRLVFKLFKYSLERNHCFMVYCLSCYFSVLIIGKIIVKIDSYEKKT